MKIPAQSFGVDMNALLNELNNFNGLNRANAIYKKAVSDIKPIIKQTNDSITKNMKQVQEDIAGASTDSKNAAQNYTDIKNNKMWENIQKANVDLVGYINGKHDDSVSQLNSDWNILNNHETINGQKIRNNQDRINAVKSSEAQIHQELGKQIDAIRQENQSIINNNIPQATQKAMEQVRDSYPTNEVSYMGPDQFPQYATAGDICWQSGDYTNNTDINGSAYRYNGTSWIPLKISRSVFADNIFGPNIHGGNIYGANFVSEDHGVDGRSNFSVSPQGDIYARNITMDLLNNTTGNTLNRITYNTDGDQAQGLTFNNGVMSMKVDAHQDTGTYIKADAGDYEASTYLEPDYLKLRTYPINSDASYIYGRTDIRGGNLEISDNWSQNTGIRLGYWDSYLGQQGPDILIGDLSRTSAFTALGATGIVTTDINASGQIILDGKRVLTSDDRNVFNPSGLQNQINTNSSVLTQHGIRLDGHDSRFSQDEHGPTRSLDSHESRLDNIDSKISADEQQLKQHENDDQTLADRIRLNIDKNKQLGSVNYSGDLNKTSSLSVKKDITDVDSRMALTQVLNTDIKSWHYDNENNSDKKHLGSIIDDVNEPQHQKYYTPPELINTSTKVDSISIDNSVALLFLAVQELQKENSQLTERITKLELNK